jgi:hypothetical protein
MLKHTWDTHCDYADLNAAYLKTQEISSYVNERAREAEAMAKVFEIQEDLVNVDTRGIVAPGRRYIRDGPMSMVVRDKKGRQKLEQVHGILFNDVFLICSPPLVEKSKTRGEEKTDGTPATPRRVRRMVLYAIEPATMAGAGVINQQDEGVLCLYIYIYVVCVLSMCAYVCMRMYVCVRVCMCVCVCMCVPVR